MTNPRRRYADWKAPADDGADPGLAGRRPSCFADTPRTGAGCPPRHASAFRTCRCRSPPAAAGVDRAHEADQPLDRHRASDRAASPRRLGEERADRRRRRRKLGGPAFHFAVDTDAPKHLRCAGPAGRVPITDDPACVGRVERPARRADAAHLSAVRGANSVTPPRAWTSPAAIEPFLVYPAQTLRWNRPARARDRRTRCTSSTGRWAFGITRWSCRRSAHREPYLVFVHHLLARADAVRGRLQRARSPTTAAEQDPHARPGRCRTCTCDGRRCEVPFWLDDLASGAAPARRRCRRRAEGLGLRIAGGERVRVRPRGRRLGRRRRPRRVPAPPQPPPRAAGADAHAVLPPAAGRPVRSRHRRRAVRPGDRRADRTALRPRAAALLRDDGDALFPRRRRPAAGQPACRARRKAGASAHRLLGRGEDGSWSARSTRCPAARRERRAAFFRMHGRLAADSDQPGRPPTGKMRFRAGRAPDRRSRRRSSTANCSSRSSRANGLDDGRPVRDGIQRGMTGRVTRRHRTGHRDTGILPVLRRRTKSFTSTLPTDPLAWPGWPCHRSQVGHRTDPLPPKSRPALTRRPCLPHPQ